MIFSLVPHRSGWSAVHIFGEWYGCDVVSADAARAIMSECKRLTCDAPEIVRLDPASSAKMSIGNAAFNEFAMVMGERRTAKAPHSQVQDGLDQMELMLGTPPAEPRILIHPRCTGSYQRFSHTAEPSAEANF